MSTNPYRFAEGTAVVTGAASGIGENLAYGLAVRGSNLVLLDRDGGRLDAVASTIRGRHPGLSVSTLVVDLADRTALDAAAQQILAEHPQITLLVNNAGVALGGDFSRLTLDEFDWVMDINFHAPVRLTHHLLPALTAQPGGHLVNVSSLFGLIAPPGQSAYCASKFGIRGFSEVLRSELAQGGTGVTTVHPGGIKTRIASDARVGVNIPADEAEQGKRDFAKLLTIPPEKAAEQIIDGIEHRRARVLIGMSAKIPDVLARLFPANSVTVFSRLVGAAGAAQKKLPSGAGAARR
ncbi:SDR family oxidoreductase [Pseudonocardia sp. KRD291]|uniref:SDR family NAD(P)-dependent oxidoreductase n=1 Tax=Pseudonocardia sp. KRD291 TaxID=2792007 RepID=UPI001C4A329D|nr:SDR family NAD(P)-dependent oxidoreductase [Pseudonocardia sp. KRD291]MBW0101116.1 SDR family NAD(P)-dependent oxidoreductase [Pseudonocardia sp. KRD291]